MKRSMEAKHLIEDTTSVVIFVASQNPDGPFSGGGDAFCWFFLIRICFMGLEYLPTCMVNVGTYSLHGASGIVQYCCCCCCDCCCCCCLFVVGGIIVLKNVVFCHPWWRDKCQIFKHHDWMMVILRKKGRTITKWNLENTSTYKIQYLFNSIRSTSWMNLSHEIWAIPESPLNKHLDSGISRYDLTS